PLVTPLGWRLHKLPLPWLKLAMVGMFVAEIPLPLAALVPGVPGAVAGLGIAGLMVGIWLSGNFGYFNLIVIALSVTLLDGDGLRGLGLASLTDPAGPLLVTHLVALHTGFALVVFPLNSFSAQAWSHWPLFQRIRPGWLAGPVHLLRALQQFRLVHPFGVFPPGTMPGVKCVTVIEATHDGTDWFECRHRFSPTTETSRPRFVAPHHPRGDQAVIYETFGLNGTSILHAFIGTGLPYAYSHVSGAKLLVDRMLDGRAAGYSTVFFAEETTERLRVPPVAVRIRTVMLEPTSVAEQRESGRWWRRTTIGPHLPETRRDPGLRGDVLPPPELWHWEDVLWKRRTHLERVRRAALAGASSTSAALEWPEGLGAADVEAFWSEFVPRVARADRSNWDDLPALARRLEAELGRDALRRHERILGRLCFGLAAKLEPLFLGEGLPPLLGLRPATIDVKSYLHLGMLLHVIALEGREAFERVWEDPRRAAEHAAGLTLAGGLFLQALFRNEAFVFEAQKLRLLQAILEPERDDRPPPPPAIQALAERAFGAVEVIPFLREQFRGVAAETGEPERYPRFALPPDGRAVRVPEVA
ncbi:MAG: lipase maturation factor family protein, partial [Deltaproteobacteria bacterium]|nr:lipase maturation factor family protein [Deltaproteobacteria bacterium]